MDGLECYDKEVYASERGNLRKIFDLEMPWLKWNRRDWRKKRQCSKEEFIEQYPA